MKVLAASAFAVASAGGLLLEAQTQAQSRHFEFGIFTINLGEAADLTGDHIPLKFVQVWPHPFGNRAINISVHGKSYTVGVGARIDLKSRYLWRSSDDSESTLGSKDHCTLEITDFDNPEAGKPKVTFALDCK
jgi:hypothetical protein